MTPPVFVIDTNVVIAGLIAGTNESVVASVLYAMLSGSLPFVLSPELLDEYRAVFSRPRVTGLHGLTEAEVDQLLVELAANAIWREPATGSPGPIPATITFGRD